MGKLFRDWGEEYIARYRPDVTKIKLIRSIRVCRTPALGGRKYECKGCGDKKYVYHSCGNSRCPKCQGIKRLQWQEKLTSKLLACPYQHIVFTLPSELRTLAKRNPSALYNCIIQSSWQSLKHTCEEENENAFTPGAVMVLHTFGSDLKYHVHVHALVTYGGKNKEGDWCWPDRKKKIVPFRAIRRNYREIFLKRLEEIYPSLNETIAFESLTKGLDKKQWTVHQEPPTMNPKTIATYLSKYINRIGLSINRFNYDEIHQQVTLVHKDYRNAKDPIKAPPMDTKCLDPLLAINQILQHSPPKYFHRTRYYGMHASVNYKKSKEGLKTLIKNEKGTVKTVVQLITIMLGIDIEKCQKCGHKEISSTIIAGDSNWIHTWLEIKPRNKSPSIKLAYNPYSNDARMGKSVAMFGFKPKAQKSTKNALFKTMKV